jgi:hypothetical protein
MCVVSAPTTELKSAPAPSAFQGPQYGAPALQPGLIYYSQRASGLWTRCTLSCRYVAALQVALIISDAVISDIALSRRPRGATDFATQTGLDRSDR